MSAFLAHNIQHTSPSSINMWSSAPCAWVAKYLLGRKFKFSNAACAGVLAEEAVVRILTQGVSEETAIDDAIAEYNKATAFGASDADLKRGAAIKGMIENAVAELKQYGEPELGEDIIYGKKQKKVEMICRTDEWFLPVIGYLDFYYPKHGLIVDLKTTMQAPTNMSDEHIRQGGFYRGATGNMAVKFLYVTGKKAVWHEVEDHKAVLTEIKTILQRQHDFLKLGTAETLRKVVPVQQGSFYWNGDENMRREIYGI